LRQPGGLGAARAQISGSTGGNVVTKPPAPAFDDPFFFPIDGAFR
jgi:hypothetical protein